MIGEKSDEKIIWVNVKKIIRILELTCCLHYKITFTNNLHKDKYIDELHFNFKNPLEISYSSNLN